MYCLMLYTPYYNILYLWLILFLRSCRDCMAWLSDSCDDFAYPTDAKEGGYGLNITNAVVILTRDKVTGQVVLELDAL